MKNNCVLLIIFLQTLIIFVSPRKVKRYLSCFEQRLKDEMERDINAFKKDFYFLDDGDYKLPSSVIDFEKMKNEKDTTSEHKAKLFAYKYSRKACPGAKLKTYWVRDETHNLESRNWKNFTVMLIGKSGINVLIRVCFPKKPTANFGFVINMNRNCDKLIEKIDGYEDGNADIQKLG